MRVMKAMAVVLISGVLACAPAPPDTAAFEQELRQAETEFDRAVADGDVERFADMVAEDAVFFGASTLEGREAVVAAWRPLLDPDSGVSLRWSPSVVEVSASGDLGVSRGDYRLTQIAEDGSISVGVGTFVAVWKRSEDGKWRAILDIGTPPQPAEAEER
jgi:ketosteroid isomerase-like protein